MNSHLVMVGVDGTLESDRAVRWAARHAAATHSTLEIVHVWNPMPYYGLGLSYSPVPSLAHELAVGAESFLARARDIVVGEFPGLPVISTTFERTRAAGLIQVSTRADVLVIGGTDRGLAGRTAFGSIANHVVAHAVCPVVVTRGSGSFDGPDAGPVVVGVDGSEASRDAVGFAMATASAWGRNVVAVGAVSVPVTEAGVGMPAQPWIEAAQVEVGEAVAGGASDYPHVKIEEVALLEHPVLALLDWSRSAGLLVVGSRGHGAFAGMLLGSVGRALVHQAECPIAVVRPLPARA